MWARRSSSLSSPVRPSEQARKRSPGTTGSGRRSASGRGPTPSARVMMCRCGCVAALSSEMYPASMSSCTTEWSVVSCSSTPSCQRYTRESPTWNTAHCGPSPSSTSATPATVVPAPALSGPSNARISPSARCSASRIASTVVVSHPVNEASASTTASAAAAPPTCPPMPSATANTGGAARYLSWLSSRWPTAVAAPHVNSTGGIHPPQHVSTTGRPVGKTRWAERRRAATHPQGARSPTPSPKVDPVEAALADLDRREQVAQLIVVGVALTDLSPADEFAAEGLGGVFLQGRSSIPADELATETARWAEAAPGPRPWIGVDQEGGAVQTLSGPGFADLPSAVDQGRMAAEELAPLADDMGAALSN